MLEGVDNLIKDIWKEKKNLAAQSFLGVNDCVEINPLTSKFAVRQLRKPGDCSAEN